VPDARQRPPTRTSPAHSVVSNTPGLTHQLMTSRDEIARKTRSGIAGTSTLATAYPSAVLATAHALSFDVLLILIPPF
jgi:hypothetical protein